MVGTNGDGNTQSLKVVAATDEILEILTRTEAIGVTELADRLEIPKTTAHSYLKSLENCGLAENEKGRYSASLKILEYAGRVRDRMDLYNASRSKVDQLAKETGEAVNVGVRDGDEQVTVYMAEGENAIWDQPSIGNRTSLNQTAIGKSVLAHLSGEQVRKIIDRNGLPAKTEYTITDEEELFRELKTIREQGYAVQDEEYQTGVFAIGVPIRVDDKTIGAVSVTGPASRLSNEEVQKRNLEKLIECVNVIEIQYEHYL